MNNPELTHAEWVDIIESVERDMNQQFRQWRTYQMKDDDHFQDQVAKFGRRVERLDAILRTLDPGQKSWTSIPDKNKGK